MSANWLSSTRTKHAPKPRAGLLLRSIRWPIGLLLLVGCLACCRLAVAHSDAVPKITLATADENTEETDDNSTPDPQGLKGIWPEYAPRDIDGDAFGIDEEAEEQEKAEEGTDEENAAPDAEAAKKYLVPAADVPRYKEIFRNVGTLYGKMPNTIAEQRGLIARLHKDVRTLESFAVAADDTTKRLKLWTLSRRLHYWTDLAETILDTLAINTYLSPDAALLGQTQTLNAWFQARENGSDWSAYLGLTNITRALTSPGSLDVKREVVQKSLDFVKDLGPDATDAQKELLENRQIVAWRAAVERYLAATAKDGKDRATEQLRRAIFRPNPKDEFEYFGLIHVLEKYELARRGYTANSADTEKLLDELTLLTTLTPDGGRRFAMWFKKHYFNINSRLAVSEPLLQRQFDRQSTRTEPVADSFQGSQIFGWQTTDTRLSVDIVPNDEYACMKFLLNSRIGVRATAMMRCLKVYTQGNHSAGGSKLARFDGQRFVTDPGRLDVQASNWPYDADLFGECVPLLGNVLYNYTMTEARRNVPESNWMTRRKILQRAQPEFNEAVDEGIDQLNARLQERFFGRLAAQGLEPRNASAWSTETLMLTDCRYGDHEELGGSPVPVLPTDSDDLTLVVHESFLNAILRRMNVAGRSLTDQEFRAELERFFSELFGTEVRIGGSEKTADTKPVEKKPAAPEKPVDKKNEDDKADKQDDQPDRFVFVDDDPVNVRIENNTLILTLRTAFDMASRDELIPPHSVSVEYAITLEGDKIVLQRGDEKAINATAIGEVDRTLQFGRSVKIREKMNESLPVKREFSRVLAPQDAASSTAFRVKHFVGIDGWLSVKMDEVDTDPQVNDHLATGTDAPTAPAASSEPQSRPILLPPPAPASK